MTPHETVLHLLSIVRDALTATGDKAVPDVLARLSEQNLDLAHAQTPVPTTLPVLTHLDQCLTETRHWKRDLAEAIETLRPHFRWLQSKAYNDALLGTGFVENYGWTEIIGPQGFFNGDDFLLGLLMLGPHQHYRDHFHPAPELYWPLTSQTLWRKGDGSFETKAAGDVIWHEPMMLHATKTEEQPLLALWCWTKDTATPARLV